MKLTAVVVGDIPRYRGVWLYNSEDEKTMRVGLPKEKGNYIDFVTTRDLKDGEEITINIKGDPIWKIEAATKIKPGSSLSIDTDGRVGQYTSSPIRIGSALHEGNEGEVVEVFRNSKVYWHNIID